MELLVKSHAPYYLLLLILKLITIQIHCVMKPNFIYLSEALGPQ